MLSLKDKLLEAKVITKDDVKAAEERERKRREILDKEKLIKVANGLEVDHEVN